MRGKDITPLSSVITIVKRNGNKEKATLTKLMFATYHWFKFTQFTSGCSVFMMIHRTLADSVADLVPASADSAPHGSLQLPGFLQGIHSVRDDQAINQS